VRRGAVRRGAVVAVAAAVALIAAGCGSSGSHASPPVKPRRVYTYSTTIAGRTTTTPSAPSPAEIRHGAELTAAKPGFSAGVRARIGVPQLGGDVTAVGTGRFDPRSESGALNLVVKLPGLFGLAGPLPTQVVLAGHEAYVQVPAGLANQLPTPASWLEASISDLGLGSSLSPSDILREVARDATRAVPDQHARVTIDSGTGLVRSLVLIYFKPGSRYHVSVMLRFSGFGAEPASHAPPPHDVGNLISTLQELGF
jgi:hypothetical protein